MLAESAHPTVDIIFTTFICVSLFLLSFARFTRKSKSESLISANCYKNENNYTKHSLKNKAPISPNFKIFLILG